MQDLTGFDKVLLRKPVEKTVDNVKKYVNIFDSRFLPCYDSAIHFELLRRTKESAVYLDGSVDDKCGTLCYEP